VSYHDVTLLTGDRVGVSDDGHVVVRDNPTRHGVSFTTLRLKDDVLVIPSDADRTRHRRCGRR
jgi:hypothetical protein